MAYENKQSKKSYISPSAKFFELTVVVSAWTCMRAASANNISIFIYHYKVALVQPDT